MKNDKNKKYEIESAMEDNLIGRKLAEARKIQHIPQGKFVEALHSYGISLSRSAYSGWEHGFRTPNAYQFLGLCEALGIGDIREYFLDDSVMERGMERLNEEGKEKVREYIQLLIDSGRYALTSAGDSDPDTENNLIDFPLYLLPASAGTGQFLDGDTFEMISLAQNHIPENADFGIRIAGDSMEPLFLSGQIAFIQKTTQLHPGDIGVFIVDGESYIKQYDEVIPSDDELSDYLYAEGNVQKKPVLVSINKKYPPIIVSREQRFEIVGKVLNRNGFDYSSP